MSSIETIRTRLSQPRTKQILFVTGIVILILALAFMIYAILVTPSKQPYRDALAEYKNVYNANVAVMATGSSLNASTATDEQFAKSTKAVTNALTALKKENEVLGKEAVLQSGEGKAYYDAFTKKLTTYIAYNTNLIISMQKVRPVVFACSQSMANVTENAAGVAVMQGCSDNFKNLTNVPDKDYQQLLETSQGIYADFAANLQAKAALPDPTGADAAQAKVYTQQQTQILSDLSAASKTFSSSLQQHRQDVDITDAAMALDHYLSVKSNIF